MGVGDGDDAEKYGISRAEQDAFSPPNRTKRPPEPPQRLVQERDFAGRNSSNQEGEAPRIFDAG